MNNPKIPSPKKEDNNNEKFPSQLGEESFIAKIKSDYNINEIKELNLWQKICIIQNLNLEIRKSGKNDRIGAFRTWNDIKAATLIPLSLLHLTIVEDVLTNEEANYKTQTWTEERPAAEERGETRTRTWKIYQVEASKKWRIVNADKPDEVHYIQKRFAGTNNSLDWAWGTLEAYAIKYLLITLFLIPEETLDPDKINISDYKNFAVSKGAYLYLELVKFRKSNGKEIQEEWTTYAKNQNFSANWEKWDADTIEKIENWIGERNRD